MASASDAASVRLVSLPWLAVRGFAEFIRDENLSRAYRRERLLFLADVFVSWAVFVDRQLSRRVPARADRHRVLRIFVRWRNSTPGLCERVVRREAAVEEAVDELQAFLRGHA